MQGVYRIAFHKKFPGVFERDREISPPSFPSEVKAELERRLSGFPSRILVGGLKPGNKKVFTRNVAEGLLLARMGAKPLEIESWEAQMGNDSVHMSRIPHRKGEPPEFVLTFSESLSSHALGLYVKPGRVGNPEIYVIPNPEGFGGGVEKQMEKSHHVSPTAIPDIILSQLETAYSGAMLRGKRPRSFKIYPPASGQEASLPDVLSALEKEGFLACMLDENRQAKWNNALRAFLEDIRIARPVQKEKDSEASPEGDLFQKHFTTAGAKVIKIAACNQLGPGMTY